MGKKGKRQYTPLSKKQESDYPSRYGSHASMVVKNDLSGAWVACKDGRGLYITSELHLDNGLMDPWRIATTPWRNKTFKKQFPDLVAEKHRIGNEEKSN